MTEGIEDPKQSKLIMVRGLGAEGIDREGEDLRDSSKLFLCDENIH